MKLTSNTILSLTVAAMLTTAVGCSGETDESVADAEMDAGDDVEHEPVAPDQAPSVDSIDIETAEPAGLERLYVKSSDTAGVISETEPLRAASYFEADQAERLLGSDEFNTTSIAGQEGSAKYNSIRYAAEDSFGVGLQIWDLEGEEESVGQRIDELRSQFLGVRDGDADALGDQAFVSQRSGLRTVVFGAESAPYVFALSCDLDSCEDIDEAVELAAEIAGEH